MAREVRVTNENTVLGKISIGIGIDIDKTHSRS